MEQMLEKLLFLAGQGVPSGPPVKARLKWFNGPNGFGFVNPEGREGVDAFLHITTLQKIGVQILGEGASLSCHIEYGDKGAYVTHVVDVIDAGILPKGVSAVCPDNGEDPGRTQRMKGAVKWYRADQGYGFIVPDDGQKEVFIHKTCLDRHDVTDLSPGQRVSMTFRVVPKGREVVSFKLVDDKN